MASVVPLLVKYQGPRFGTTDRSPAAPALLFASTSETPTTRSDASALAGTRLPAGFRATIELW